MSDSLRDNAKKCMDTLHKLLGAWFVLITLTTYLPVSPASAQIKLPLTDVTIPSDSVRWACMFAIFFVGVVGQSIIEMLKRLSIEIANIEKVNVILSYPSITTLGTPVSRGFFCICLAFIQHMVAAQVLPPWHLWGGDMRLVAAFLFCSPMLFFGAALANWQTAVMNDTRETPSADGKP